MVQDPRPSGSYYTKRFMQALGSANVYTHGAACNMSKNSGFTQVIGAGDYLADVENAKACMFIAAATPTPSARASCTPWRRRTRTARTSCWSTRA